MFNDEEGITHFTPYGTPIQRSPDAAQTDQLSLALEPECVALYCQQLPIDLIAEYADQNVNDTKSCIVLDIGGGTVDITALKQVAGSYEVTITPTGNKFGGTEVNEEFRRFLQQIVGDKDFRSFLKNRSTHEEHNALLQKIIYRDFEKEKVDFGSKVDYLIRRRAETQPAYVPETQANKQVPVPFESSCTPHDDFRFRVELPEAFLKCYKKMLQQELKKRHGVKLEESKRLLMFGDSMMKSFFEPVLFGIGCPVIRAVNEAKKNGLSVVYMAGGFGGCKYVYQYLKDKIKLLLQDTKFNVPLIVPTDHMLAVCRGAVLYGRNPGAITMRKMEASYGIRVSKPFKEGEHEECHAYDDQGTKRCGNIFRPFVVQGDRVKADEVFTITLAPQFQTDTEARIGFYCSTNPDVRYTSDADTSQIGEIKLSIPNPTDQPVTERIIEIAMNLSSTEIKATAQASYLNDKPLVSTVLDFLN